MAGLGDVVQKAFYLGVGIASFAGEKAGENLAKLRSQAQKLADEMVERGELTTEEAKKMVDDMVKRAQGPGGTIVDIEATEATTETPRNIEITDEEPSASTDAKAEQLRKQVADLEEQLRQLKK
ncbi:MAG: phasin family protein [Leptolyngbyaceae cyanobacterium]